LARCSVIAIEDITASYLRANKLGIMPSHAWEIHLPFALISVQTTLPNSTSKPVSDPSGAQNINGSKGTSIAIRTSFQSLASIEPAVKANMQVSKIIRVFIFILFFIYWFIIVHF
jgi:hypothetical protein